jgi:hypothetical protein
MPPLPKICPKTVSAPRKGVAFLRKTLLQKSFFGGGGDSAGGALAFERLRSVGLRVRRGRCLASKAPRSAVRKLGLLQVRHRLLRRETAYLCLKGGGVTLIA